MNWRVRTLRYSVVPPWLVFVGLQSFSFRLFRPRKKEIAAPFLFWSVDKFVPLWARFKSHREVDPVDPATKKVCPCAAFWYSCV